MLRERATGGAGVTATPSTSKSKNVSYCTITVRQDQEQDLCQSKNKSIRKIANAKAKTKARSTARPETQNEQVSNCKNVLLCINTKIKIKNKSKIRARTRRITRVKVHRSQTPATLPSVVSIFEGCIRERLLTTLSPRAISGARLPLARELGLSVLSSSVYVFRCIFIKIRKSIGHVNNVEICCTNKNLYCSTIVLI